MKDTLIHSVKSFSNIIEKSSNSSNIDKGWFEILLINNPGLITIIITGLFLPIGLLWHNNRKQETLKINRI